MTQLTQNKRFGNFYPGPQLGAGYSPAKPKTARLARRGGLRGGQISASGNKSSAACLQSFRKTDASKLFLSRCFIRASFRFCFKFWAVTTSPPVTRRTPKGQRLRLEKLTALNPSFRAVLPARAVAWTLALEATETDFSAFLTGTRSQTEFDVTHSKQTLEEILTGTRIGCQVITSIHGAGPESRVVQCTPMEPRRVTVFFYGLFMDAELVRSHGVHPMHPRPACVPGFALRIGQRATLMPSAESSAYGILMELSHSEVERLYSEPSLSAYRSEAVMAQLADGSYIPALCFNLVVPPAPEEANAEYAANLRELAGRLKLPQAYVEGIR